MATQDQAVPDTVEPVITVPAAPRPDIKVNLGSGGGGGGDGRPQGGPQAPGRTEPVPPELPGIAERAPAATAGALVLLTVAIALAGWYLPAGTNWLVVLALIVIFFLITGKVITGRVLGVFINERKLMSLSRFQLVVWTGLIVSGFFVIALERIHSGAAAQPLAIGIDWQIWALLGISAASFVGTPLLNSNKKSKEPDRKDELVTKAATRFQEHPDDVERNRQGILYGNSSVAFARFTDMFQGDELANAQLVDVAKLQLFFFTIVVAMPGKSRSPYVPHSPTTDFMTSCNQQTSRPQHFFERYADGDNPDPTIRAVQIYLTYRGFNPGAVDGFAGDATRRAIVAFQQSTGMAQTGKITDPLLEQLSAAA